MACVCERCFMRRLELASGRRGAFATPRIVDANPEGAQAQNVPHSQISVRQFLTTSAAFSLPTRCGFQGAISLEKRQPSGRAKER